jgi:hypothetical protein
VAILALFKRYMSKETIMRKYLIYLESPSTLEAYLKNRGGCTPAEALLLEEQINHLPAIQPLLSKWCGLLKQMRSIGDLIWDLEAEHWSTFLVDGPIEGMAELEKELECLEEMEQEAQKVFNLAKESYLGLVRFYTRRSTSWVYPTIKYYIPGEREAEKQNEGRAFRKKKRQETRKLKRAGYVYRPIFMVGVEFWNHRDIKTMSVAQLKVLLSIATTNRKEQGPGNIKRLILEELQGISLGGNGYFAKRPTLPNLPKI